MTDMPTTYESKTTTTTTSTGGGGIGFQPDYIRTIPGILKIVEIVLALLTFICSVVKYWAHIGGGWVDFVSMTAFICTLLLFLFHLMGLINQIPLPMNVVELIYYALFTFFFLIAAIVAAVKGHLAAAIGATAFFAFAATAVYAVDTFFQFRAYRSGQTEMSSTSATTTTTTTHSETQQAQY